MSSTLQHEITGGVAQLAGEVEPEGATEGIEPNTCESSPSRRRALGLFVVRESDEFDRELFNAMREQTYAAWPALEDVQLARALGMRPMLERRVALSVALDGGQREVSVEVLKRGRTTAFLFQVGEYWHFWSMASATRVNDNRINEVTSLIQEVLERLRPENVYVHNISRLIRSSAQGAMLQASIEENVDVIWAGRVPFHFRGEAGQAGKLMFSMFAQVASMERDWIVQRLLAGKIAKWRRGEWPFGKASVPFGYKVDPKTRRLVVDPAKVPMVREMLKVLAYGVTPSQMKRDLDKAGVVGMKPHRRLGGDVPVGVMVSSGSLVNSLHAYASVWCRGEFLYRHVNVFRDLDNIAGVDVVRDLDDERDMGELQMLYKLPVPDGGWASPEVLEMFAAAAISNTKRLQTKGHKRMRPLSRTVELESADPHLLGIVLTGKRLRVDDLASRKRLTSRAKEFVSPFSGRGWRDGKWWYELLAAGGDVYKLVRWPLRDEKVRDRSGYAGQWGEDG